PSSLESSSFFFLYPPRAPRDLHSFPTRRSSDLVNKHRQRIAQTLMPEFPSLAVTPIDNLFPYEVTSETRVRAISRRLRAERQCRDRKSTRLNSSHVKISYAVFCLKKKTDKKQKR